MNKEDLTVLHFDESDMELVDAMLREDETVDCNVGDVSVNAEHSEDDICTLSTSEEFDGEGSEEVAAEGSEEDDRLVSEDESSEMDDGFSDIGSDEGIGVEQTVENRELERELIQVNKTSEGAENTSQGGTDAAARMEGPSDVAATPISVQTHAKVRIPNVAATSSQGRNRKLPVHSSKRRGTQ